jgi:hypothetical protein
VDSQGKLKAFQTLVHSAYKRSECSDIKFSRKPEERIETRSTGEYRRSVYEDFACAVIQ